MLCAAKFTTCVERSLARSVFKASRCVAPEGVSADSTATAAGLAAGFGLIQREPWARTLVLILAFISLFINIPIGTAIGIYTMWVLLPAESEQEYSALTTERAA